MGPAAVGLVLTQKWVLGALVQQWWSYAGDDDRRDVSLLNLQYFVYRFLPNRWQVGLGSPVISANWKATKNLGVNFYYAHAFGKSVIRNIYPSGIDGDFGYAELVYHWNPVQQTK